MRARQGCDRLMTQRRSPGCNASRRSMTRRTSSTSIKTSSRPRSPSFTIDRRRTVMAQLVGKRFDAPDEVRGFTDGKGRIELVDLNGHSVGLGTFEPGWRWSHHVKPIANTTSCQVEHIGYILE